MRQDMRQDGELCYASGMTNLFRLFAWLLATAVTFVTLAPPRFRPHSYVGQDGDHTLAFIMVGLAFAFAYPRHRWSAMVISVIAIGALELLQLAAPGRHARLEDFVVDALAAIAGFALAAALDWMKQRRWKPS
jgi:phosphoglycerol transferase MdoB-like AlkP superfamily enzyme